MSQTTLAQLPMGQIGFGAMHITGSGIWGPPRSEGEAIALFGGQWRRASSLSTPPTPTVPVSAKL